MYVFVENKENERTGTTEQFPFASWQLGSLKKAIRKKHKGNVVFQKKYNAVLRYDGEVLGWIRRINKVV
jgi:hypothetical protein